MLKSSISIFFFFFAVICLSAQTVSWVGGRGAWSDPNNWNTGMVPRHGQSVWIDCNCKVVIERNSTARASSVSVRPGTLLGIERNAMLDIQIETNGGTGLTNLGTVSTNGFINIEGNRETGGIAINNIGEFSTTISAEIYVNNFQKAIENSGDFTTGADIFIENISSPGGGSAIRLMDGNFFNNYYGSITIEDVTNIGISLFNNSSF